MPWFPIVVRSAASGLPPANSPSGNFASITTATTVSIHFIVTALTNLEAFLDGLLVTFAILDTFRLLYHRL